MIEGRQRVPSLMRKDLLLLFSFLWHTLGFFNTLSIEYKGLSLLYSELGRQKL